MRNNQESNLKRGGVNYPLLKSTDFLRYPHILSRTHLQFHREHNYAARTARAKYCSFQNILLAVHLCV